MHWYHHVANVKTRQCKQPDIAIFTTAANSATFICIYICRQLQHERCLLLYFFERFKTAYTNADTSQLIVQFFGSILLSQEFGHKLDISDVQGQHSYFAAATPRITLPQL